MAKHCPRSLSLGRLLRDEGGQAVMLLLLIAVSMLFFLSLMYHSGVLILIKMRLQNTADVSAMAGAIVQAEGMQTLARLNRDIVGTVVAANEDAFGEHAPFLSDAAARSYIDDEYLSQIRRLAQEIRTVQRDYAGLAREAATLVARANLGDEVDVVWHTPRLPGGRLVELKPQKKASFYYVLKRPQDEKAKRRSFKAPAFFDGKSRKVVYSAVEVRLHDLEIGDDMISSNIDEMVAYAAAKPWGGYIGGMSVDPMPSHAVFRWDLDIVPKNFAFLYLRLWIPWGLRDPTDYDAWLVRIGDRRLNPPPVRIPEYRKFLH